MNDGKKKFYYVMGIALILFILAVTVGVIVFFNLRTGEMKRLLSSEEQEEFEKYYTMIVNDRSSEFWKSVYEGAREDGEETGAYVELLGSNLAKDYTREELMKIAISSGVDGIIVEADEGEEITALINLAVSRGIPVVTVLGDNTSGERQSFIGVGSYNLGREYGRQVIRLCGREARNVLVLMSGNTNSTSQNVLYSGIQETIEKEMPADGRALLEMKAVDSKSAFSAEESIRDIFMSGEKLPDIILCLDERSTACVYQAVVDYNKVGQIDIIGYYDSPATLQAISRNVIYSTISIDTAQMGRYCVEALNEYNELGNVSEYFSVDVTVINANNIRKYLGGETADEQ